MTTGDDSTAGSTESRWTTLRDLAAEGRSPQDVYYRWVDHLDQPVHASEFTRGGDTFVLWEDRDGRWVVEGASAVVRSKPRRFFASRQQAQDALHAEHCLFQRIVPVYRWTESPTPTTGRHRWLGLTFAALLFLAIAAALVAIVYMVVTQFPAVSSETRSTDSHAAITALDYT